ncbi:MAG: reverse transcriptase family protein, partial [Saccharospirillaceae bacterium]|nr:reverse transcriptase family protein [Saccharospirillaceae bacterium]
FHLSFKELYDKWFIKSVNHRKSNYLRKDWITIGIASSCKNKNILYRKWCQNKTKKAWNDYIIYKRELDKQISKAKYDFYDREFNKCKSDLKKTWQSINNILGRNVKNKLLTFPGHDASHNFNKYFTNVAQNLLNEQYNNEKLDKSTDFRKFLKQNDITQEDDEEPFSVSDLKNFINNLNNNKSSYFRPKILKLVTKILCPVLIKLFTSCYKDGYFPNELKIAKVIPIYKNRGDIKELSNYRPISMLPTFSKLFEKLIHKHLLTYFNQNNIISSSQYGFRAGHSTLHALINATENAYRALDQNYHTLGIFLDFSKAFDTVNHAILLSKLKHYGINKSMLTLLTSYLSNRFQYVSYGDSDSTLLPITTGVPQGSVLGPLLFIIFINDLSDISNNAKFILFADDANMFLSHTDRKVLYKQANDTLYRVYEYCISNRIIINIDKCSFIEFGKHSNNEKLHLGILNNTLENVNKCKFLGVYINKDLNWKDHMIHVKQQLSKATGAINMVKGYVPQKILRNIYFSLIQPYLIYCLPIWGSNHNCTEFHEIFVVQKRALRIITNNTAKINNQYQHTKPLFQKTNILTVHNLYYYLISNECRKLIINRSPIQIYNLYNISSHSKRLILPLYKHSIPMKLSFIFNSSKILNYFLSQEIDYTVDINHDAFKNKLKRHLMFRQSFSYSKNSDWLPCNTNIFSDVVFRHDDKS